MKILDPFIDLVIGKCQTFVTTQVQNAFEPVCDDLRQQIKALQNEFFYKQAPVHVRLKRYCFKRSDTGKFAPSQLLCMECHFGCYYQTCPGCGRKDGNSDSEKDNSDNMHDQLHVENGFKLVRYFEKLVRDEVSTSNSAPVLSDSNLMHSDQFNTGVNLQDCTDFDEPMNDFHSTAACAQLLQYSLTGSQEPTP